MTFVRFWMGFTAVGLAATVLLLLWAVGRRQCKESDRAGYLPLADLDDDEAGPEGAQAGGRRTALALAGVMGVGLLALAASVIVALMEAP